MTPGVYDLIILNALTIKNGNVGIGTTNPVSTLDVTGGSGLWVRSGTGGSLKSSAGSGIRILQGSNGSHHIFAFNYNTNQAEDLNLQQPGGNVGIGTTSPGSKLDVTGRIQTDYLRVDPQNTTNEGGEISLLGAGTNPSWNLDVYENRFRIFSSGTERFSIRSDGNTVIFGTLHVTGADLAEPFDMTDIASLNLGDVVVIDPVNPLHVTKSIKAYDTTVAGIVSSTTQAGYVAGSRSDGTSDKPIALVGRVLCNVSTENGAINIGDLLTTSNTPGYAMKATEFPNAYGAIMGKALQAFDGDKGQIMVLVTL